MKTRNILVTGGAGFIGSFLVDSLIKDGFNVTILDNLEQQVHFGKKPKYLSPSAKFIKGDVRDYNTFRKVLRGVDIIFHLASAVGVGQSNYEVKKYIDANVTGTANLLDLLVNSKHSVQKLITVSSMTGLGEGNYRCKKCGTVRPPLREVNQLKLKDWDIYCPNCHSKVSPIPTDEKAFESPNSIYAISKKTQQDMSLLIGSIYRIPTTVLRFFNVYGPRQSLSNPYTGVTAIFISRLKNNQPVVIYEDGLQSRDFVSVHDVVSALKLAMRKKSANYQLINIGSGQSTAIKDIAQILSQLLNTPNLLKISQEFRRNDIRHCIADISKAKKLLGWEPKISLEEGLEELIHWSEKEKASDQFSLAEKQLRSKGIL